MKGRLRDNQFIRAVMLLMSGSMTAQAVTLLLSPLLSRIFSPEEMGVYTVLQSCVSMFSVILSLRYDMVIVSEQDEENVCSLVALSFILCIINSILVTVGCVVYLSFKEVDGLNLGLGSAFILFQSLLTGAINILSAYNNRLREYRVISSTYVIRTSVQNALMVLAGFVRSGTTGLMVSSTAGLLCGVGRQAKSLTGIKEKLKKVCGRDLYRIACVYRKQALIFTPAIFLNGFFYSGMNLLIDYLYGAHALGLYSYSYRILVLPITLISANISRVFMEHASREWAEKGNFRKTYFQTIALIVVMAIPIWAILKLYAPWLFEFVFGAQWKDAGIYVQMLITMFSLRLIAGCVNGAAVIVGKQKYDLFIQLALAFSLVGIGAAAFASGWDILTFFGCINICASAIYIVYVVLFYLCAQGKNSKEQ